MYDLSTMAFINQLIWLIKSKAVDETCKNMSKSKYLFFLEISLRLMADNLD